MQSQILSDSKSFSQTPTTEVIIYILSIAQHTVWYNWKERITDQEKCKIDPALRIFQTKD